MPGLERAPAASALVRVTESSQVGEARRTAAALCHRLGFEDTEGGRVSIVATELATNLVKHGGGGEVLIRSLREGDVSGIEMMALDRGPGIRDLDAALTDGNSTAGTPGGGLGAIRRLSSAFDVYTSHGHGTAVLSRLWQRAAPGSSVVHGAVCVAKSGEDECGDAWDVEVRAAGCRVVVADGLGHGRLAREAAVTALGATYDRPGPSRALEDAHLASRSTRGAAITIADVDIAAQEVRLAGLGNVVAALVGDERVQNMVSMNGTAGQGALKVREFTYRFTPGALLVMASDGLATHWSLDRYPGLSERHPALIAGVLYRDHSRQRDDVTIVAARLGTRALNAPLLTIALEAEHDVVLARQRARQLARHLGFDAQDQARIATAVSEIARNVIEYAGRGRLEFVLEGRTAPQILAMHFSDDGPGIADLDAILGGRYESRTGMGVGLVGARRLMDQFQIDSAPGRGTTVHLRKFLPRSVPVRQGAAAREIVDVIVREGLQNPLAEVRHQNQELVTALGELRRRQEDLVRVNRELEDTNRGVVALYAELDEKAEHLRRADEMKTRFLSNMSHEFRTPLNSILAISRLLAQRSDGELTAEQEKQVGFILEAAQDLTEIVDDLLDLAKVEAGKIVIRPVEFDLGLLFGALRGMLRPLLVGETVALVFEEPVGIPPLYGDEGKVSQILRNFLSNALKFTEKGEIRVRAVLDPGGEKVVISVSDTGIGIAPADQLRIFEEFAQVEHAVQKKVKGTGLGLALSRRLAEVLGGTIALDSEPGRGSTFSLHIPIAYAPPATTPVETLALDPRRIPILVLDDDPANLHVYDRILRDSEFQPVTARTIRDAEVWLATGRPRALVLDIQLNGEDGWGLLAELKGRTGTAALPVVVITTVEDERKALALGADAYRAQPVEGEWLLGTLRELAGPVPRSVLIVDDDEASRYVLRGLAGRLGLVAEEAVDGAEGARRAAVAHPSAMFLDLVMPGLGGQEVLRRLRGNPMTARMPVVVVTSKRLEPHESRELEDLGGIVLAKSRLSSPDAMEQLADALQRAGTAAEAAAGPRAG